MAKQTGQHLRLIFFSCPTGALSKPGIREEPCESGAGDDRRDSMMMKVMMIATRAEDGAEHPLLSDPGPPRLLHSAPT